LLFALKWILRKTRGHLDTSNEENVKGKTVVVTGASAGLGKATTLELVKRGANVVLACRNVIKANEVVDDIKRVLRNNASGTMTVMELDLSEMESVRRFAKAFKSKYDKLDILINNAGLSNEGGGRRYTKDGFEEHFGVNHLSHWLLTNLLLDELKRAAPSRVVIVSSGAHMLGKMNFDDIMSEKEKPVHVLFISGLYCNSKLANNLFNLELSKRLRGSGVSSYALCPGVVQTDIGSGTSEGFIAFAKALFFFVWGKTAAEGAATILHCALSKHVSNHSGEMYRNCEYWDPRRRMKLSENDAQKLWELSEKMVGIK